MTADIEAFLGSTVFLPTAGDDSPPGLSVSGSPGWRWVCVFSDLERLAGAVAARPGTPRTWFSMTGRDLAAALPRGCGVVVDPLSAVPTFLQHADIAAAVAVAGGEVADE